jgi:alpha-mannosidase
MEYTPEAQCLGRHEFDYALIPHSGTWQSDDARVLREAQVFNTPVHTRTVVTEPHNGSLPAHASLIQVEPCSLVVSAVKRSNDGCGLIVRVYNPMSKSVTAKIQPGVAFVQAYMANLLEERQELLTTTSNDPQTVEVVIRSEGITTLVFE